MFSGKSINGYPFRIETNVNAKVVGPNRALKQTIDTHNMATASMTEGVVRFLRGEFTEAFVAGHMPNIGDNFNIADQFIPAYVGIGCAGVSKFGDTLTVNYDSGMTPSYSDTELVSEILPVANPSRALITKSVKGSGTLSQAHTLTLSAVYHFDTKAETQTFRIEPTETRYIKGRQFYISDNIFPGQHIEQRLNKVTATMPNWSVEPPKDTSSIGTIRFNNTQVFEIDYNTGVLTLLMDYYFNNGLELSYDPINFDFIYKNNTTTAKVPYSLNNLVRTYNITELGLFSGNVANDKSKLLARVLLDTETPIIITEGDYIIVTWQIGVYALDDALFEEDVSGDVIETDTYKYVVQEQDTDLVWTEITDVTDEGLPVEDTEVDLRAKYNIRSIDFDTNTIKLDTSYMRNLSIGDTISIGSGDTSFKIQIRTLDYDKHTVEFDLITDTASYPLLSYTTAKAVLDLPVYKNIETSAGNLLTDALFTFTMQESDDTGVTLKDSVTTEISIEVSRGSYNNTLNLSTVFPRQEYTAENASIYYVVSEVPVDDFENDTSKYLVNVKTIRDTVVNQLVCTYDVFKMTSTGLESTDTIIFTNKYLKG